VRDRGRLRPLRVGVDGENRFAVRVDEAEQRGAQGEARRGQAEDELALAHPVHRHVDVVARARGVQPAGDVLAAGLDDQPLDVKEQVLVAAVVLDLANRVLRHPVERHPQRVRRLARHDALRLEHHQVRVVDGHQRRQQQRLGVFEVFVEDVGDVLGGEAHL
jgi:hypothetical protein